MTGLNLVALDVGNTRAQIGLFVNDRLERHTRIRTDDVAGITAEAESMWSEIADAGEAAVVTASVDDESSVGITSAIRDRLGVRLFRVGEDLPIPIGEQLDPETITGVDRLLNAAAAWDRLKQACVVVDAGTCVTVDFVDGVGTFQGGAIAPGAGMQLRAMHEHTAALPLFEFTRPDDEPYGKNTRQAMLQGVAMGIRGLVWRLVEQYATSYGAFPQVIATGGDAEAILGPDELINAIVPDLTLHGIAVAARVGCFDDGDL